MREPADIRAAQMSNQSSDTCLFVAASGGMDRSREVCQMLAEGQQLEGHRPRVGFIDEDEFHNRGKLHPGKVPSTIGHQTIGNLKDRFENEMEGQFTSKAGADNTDEMSCPLEPSSEIEEAPPVPARHVLHLHPAEGGEVYDQAIKQAQRLGQKEALGART